MLASGISPRLTWADAGAPSYLSAARTLDGSYALVGLTENGIVTFQVRLPSRGHAAATHPTRPEAVAFARRPGRFAIVLECVAGEALAELNPAPNRHFYGHGVFSADGQYLYTTENDLESGEGVIGVWDATKGYARVGEFSSGGIGPHDVKLMPDGKTLVIANGGIETHPDSGRTKLNIPTMQPRLSYVGLSGDILQQVTLPPALHRNSIRHLAVSPNGFVAFAMQWQGDATFHPPLLGVHQGAREPSLLRAPPEEHRKLRGYAGSIAISANALDVAITSPKGGVAQIFQIGSGTFTTTLGVRDVCGISEGSQGFHITSGTGLWGRISQGHLVSHTKHQYQWDNHLMPIT